jgi:hypothetical protein
MAGVLTSVLDKMINELPDRRKDGRDGLPAIFIPDKTRLIVPHSDRRMTPPERMAKRAHTFHRNYDANISYQC